MPFLTQQEQQSIAQHQQALLVTSRIMYAAAGFGAVLLYLSGITP